MKIFNLKHIISLTLIIGMGLVGCEKDPAMIDEDVPVIDLISPNSGAMFMDGDTMQIHAEITDNDQVHEIMAHITREHMGQIDTVWTLLTHSHVSTFSLYESYIIETSGMHNNFELVITASDHNENLGEKTYAFHIM